MLELITSADFRESIQFWLVALVFGSALIWGGGPEKAAATVWIVVFELSRYFTDYFFGASIQRLSVDPFSAGRDVAAGALWIGIALYANRNYTLWIAGLQVLAMFAHLSRGLSDMMSPIAYSVMTEGPGWFQLILLGLGLIWHIRRKRKFGPYRDWRITKKPDGLSDIGVNSGPVGAIFRQKSPSWRDELK